jgi:hypothetical protein
MNVSFCGLPQLARPLETDAIAPYIKDLSEVVGRCLMMKSREGYELVSSVLAAMVWSLTQVSPAEFRSVPFTLDEPVSKRLYIRYWGSSADFNDLNLRWNVPTREHLETAEGLLSRFILPILEELKRFARKEIFIERYVKHALSKKKKNSLLDSGVWMETMYTKCHNSSDSMDGNRVFFSDNK